jgi:ribosomal protein L16/L10AE
MGSGKGSHSYWACPTKAGRIVCELYGNLREAQYLKFLKGAGKKLPVKTKAVKIKY